LDSTDGNVSIGFEEVKFVLFNVRNLQAILPNMKCGERDGALTCSLNLRSCIRIPTLWAGIFEICMLYINKLHRIIVVEVIN